jgi:hypothetical protein
MREIQVLYSVSFARAGQHSGWANLVKRDRISAYCLHFRACFWRVPNIKPKAALPVVFRGVFHVRSFLCNSAGANPSMQPTGSSF